MHKRFEVVCIQTCPDCSGVGITKTLLAGFSLPCPNCSGTGEIEDKHDLLEALQCLNVQFQERNE